MPGPREIGLDQLVAKLRIAPRRYGFLLGAGCSAGANIPTASKIVSKIVSMRSQREASVDSGGISSDATKWCPTYAEALDWLGTLAMQETFLGGCIEGAKPGAVHIDLATLVEQRWITALFTTNFDHLVEQALQGPDKERATIVVHNNGDAKGVCQTGGLNPDAPNSYVVKLHGDYLLPGALNQPWQLTVLAPGYRSLFNRWLSLYGLIIVGYGSGDESVLDSLRREAKRKTGRSLGLVYVVKEDGKVPEWVDSLAKMRRDATWVEVLRVHDAEELFRKLRAALAEPVIPKDAPELPEDWETVRRRAVAHTVNELDYLEQNRVYEPSLYEHRMDAEKAFAQFLESRTSNALLFIDRAGAGKTVLLAHLSDLVARNGGIPIWYRAAKWQGSRQFQETLHRVLLAPLNVNLWRRLAELSSVLDRVDVGRYAVIFVDGVNEAGAPADVVEELNTLLPMLEGMPRVKVVVSCRGETWARYRWVAKQYWSPPGNARLDAFALRLGEFSESQISAMWEAYAKRYEVKQQRLEELPRSARELVSRNPLMLRLVAQSFGKDTLPEHLSSLQVFRRFFDIFVEGDPPLRAEPATDGERKLVELMLDLLVDFEGVVVHRQTQVDAVSAAAQRQGLPWARLGLQSYGNSPYATLVAKGVLEETQRRVPGEGVSQRCVGFVFDRLFEFKLAQRLHEMGCDARPDDLEQLILRGRDYASMWGAARTLVLQGIEGLTRVPSENEGPIMLERGDVLAARWIAGLLEERRTGLRGLVTDALVQLGEEDPDLVQAICRELLRAGDVAAAHVAVAVAVQRRDGDTLLAGCGLPDRQIRLRAAQGMVYFWQQDRELSAPVMRALGKRAREEVSKATEELRVLHLGWQVLERVLHVPFSAARHEPVGKLFEQLDRQVAHFVAFVHMGTGLAVLSRGHPGELRAAQEAFREIVQAARSSAIPLFGQAFDRMFKVVATHLCVQAIKEGVSWQDLQLELDELRKSRKVREACLHLADAEDDDLPRPSREDFRRWLWEASKGGFLTSFVIRGSLIAGLRHDPAQMVDLALELAGSADERTSWQGASAAGYLVAAAVIMGHARAEETPAWLSGLAKGIEETTRRRFSEAEERVIDAPGMHSSFLDMEHTFLACVATRGNLLSLLDGLLESVPGKLRTKRERAMIAGLALLTRLGYATEAVQALEAWQETDDPELLEELSGVYAEIVAAHPSFLEGKLEGARNPKLETRVMEKLVEVSPGRLLYQYMRHGIVALMCHPKSSKGYAEVGRGVYKPAKDPEHLLRIMCDFLYNPDDTPFYYA